VFFLFNLVVPTLPLRVLLEIRRGHPRNQLLRPRFSCSSFNSGPQELLAGPRRLRYRHTCAIFFLAERVV